jgi:hypothetical protein
MDPSRDNTRCANHAECGCSASQCGDLARMTSSPLLSNLLFGPLDSDLGRPAPGVPRLIMMIFMTMHYPEMEHHCLLISPLLSLRSPTLT